MPTVTIETIPIIELNQVPGAPVAPIDEISVAAAQKLLDELAYREANTPAPNSPWPAYLAYAGRKLFGALPDFHTYWVGARESFRWVVESGPLAVPVWMLRIDAAEALPYLAVQRIGGTLYYFGHHSNRHLLSAARLKGLASLECEITTW